MRNLALYRNPSRAVTTWTPFYRPFSLLDEMEELAERLWGSWQPGESVMSMMPHTDVYEEKGEVVVKTELPGVNGDDLEVTLEGDTLKITAEKKESVSEETTHHARERHYGRYFRSMTLPFHVDGDKVSATFDNGVLELRLTRAEEVKPRRIELKGPVAEEKPKPRQRKPRQKSS